MTEQQKFYKQADGLHGRVGGPYYDELADAQWQERHGEGTWSPGTVVVDEDRLKAEYNPYAITSENPGEAGTVTVEPIGFVETPEEPESEEEEGYPVGPDDGSL